MVLLCATILAVTVGMDMTAAEVYRSVKGYKWHDRMNPPGRMHPLGRVRSDIYHHDLAKNLSGATQIWGQAKYRIHTNSLGFKDRTVRNIPLVTDKHRILFIGDSFTEGVGVEYPDTFVGRIDSELSGSGVEVLNAGVSSYSPVIYWKKIEFLIEKAGLKFDEAVVYVDISDIQDEAQIYKLSNHRVIGKFDPLELKKSQSERRTAVHELLSFIAGRTIVADTVYMALHKLLYRPDPERILENKRRFFAEQHSSRVRDRWTYCGNVYREYGREGLRRAAGHMDRLNALLQKNGIRLTVAVYPWPRQIQRGDLDSIQVRFWKEWCRERGVDFLNYFPIFVKGGTREERRALIRKYFIKGDFHWNEAGHSLVADVFLDFYGRRGAAAGRSDARPDGLKK